MTGPFFSSSLSFPIYTKRRITISAALLPIRAMGRTLAKHLAGSLPQSFYLIGCSEAQTRAF
jgi:hypothetical protein